MGHVAEAFNAAMQYIPLAGNAVSPLDYGASCNTKAFTGNYGGQYSLTATAGSPVITINGYHPDPNTASQSGGGDVGRVAVVNCGQDEGPTTYVLSATTTSLTLGENMAVNCVANGNANVLLSGYPSDPRNPATAHDDTAAFTAAANAAVSGGGYVALPNSCMIHSWRPPPFTAVVGNMGGTNYANYWPPANSNGTGSSASTVLYVGDTGFSDDVDTSTGIARDLGIDTGYALNSTLELRLSNFQINCPNFPYLGWSGMQGTAIGQKTRGAGTNQSNYDISPEHIFLDHVAIVNCPAGLGPPLGWNHAVAFTATISGTSMNVLSITSTASEASYSTLNDFLAIGETITGSGVTTGTTITSAPVGGGTGAYGLSLSSTVTSSEAMKTVLPSIVMSGKVRDSFFGQNGIGIEGDYSDAIFENNIFTVWGMGFYLGPVTDSFGSGANRIFGGRFETSNCGCICDCCSGTRTTGRQFRGVGGTSGCNIGNAIFLKGAIALSLPYVAMV
jgi:hypothetical protein